MPAVRVTIVGYVDDAQPGWVECILIDANGVDGSIIEKVPVVSVDDLNANSVYPQFGVIECEIVDKWVDHQGREVARIELYSVADTTRFDVLMSQLT